MKALCSQESRLETRKASQSRSPNKAMKKEKGGIL